MTKDLSAGKTNEDPSCSDFFLSFGVKVMLGSQSKLSFPSYSHKEFIFARLSYSSLNVCKNLLLKPSGPEILFVGRF